MTKKKTKFDQFDGDADFSLWKIRMLAHLGTLGLKKIVIDFSLTKLIPDPNHDGKKLKDEGDKSSSSEPNMIEVPDPEKIEQSEQAMNEIIPQVGNIVLRKITHCKTVAEMWALLNRLYMETSLPNRIYLQLKLYSFQMDISKGIDTNVDDFLKIVAELDNLGIAIGEEVQALLILKSFPPGYEQLKHTLKYGNKTLELQDVVFSAKSLEREIAEQKDLDKRPSSVLYTEDRGRSSTRDGKERNGKNKSRSRSKSGTRLTCWFCKKEGHTKKDCFARKKKYEKEDKGEAGVIVEKLVYSEALSVSDQDSKDIWVIDSGCTSHMSSRRDWFSDFREDDETTILLGDNHAIKSQGIGSIKINTNGGTMKVLNNVKYVPELRRNLISSGTLDRLGYKHEGGGGKVRYFINDKTALKGELVNGLYILVGNTEMPETCNVAAENDTTALWHSRLGHLNLNSLKILSNKGLIDKKDIKELSFCENCVMGKAKKLSFNVAKHQAVDVLSYLHADLWGSPSVTPSISGCRYFLSIIDDKSRKVWLCFLRTKDETFDKFCEWKSLVENQVNKKVKCLRTDNGLEFCNTRFDDFCKSNGIERHRTCVYTPQQNGVAERMNRTLMEKVRCMLNESGLEEHFWAEAAATAAYIVNRSPCSAIDHNVPEELWLNRKPGYKHLRRFGSVAYVHHDQGKLKPRALKGVFLGYPTGTKGYKVWLVEEEKCVISRNVIFNERLNYKDIKDKSVSEDDDNAVNSKCEENKKFVSEFDRERSTRIGPKSDQSRVIGQGGVIHLDDDVSETAGSDRDDPSDHLADGSADLLSPSHRDPLSHQIARDRPRRTIVAPARFDDYSQFAFALMVSETIDTVEPQCYHEARNDKNWDKWNDAMGDEYDSLKKNKTWWLVDRPEGKKVISCRWLYKIKSGIAGVEPPRFKARLVARGYTQREGIDYQDVFSPVVKHVSIRILMSIVVNKDLELEQMDVKTAFLHGELEEELYMEQPEGFESVEGKAKVCLLKKSLYGLKQAPRQWNKRFDRFMAEEKFSRSNHDSCVYIKRVSDCDYVYLLLYVDDMLIAAKNMSDIDKLKRRLSQEFEMKDMGAASKILGIQISRDRKEGILCLDQSDYLKKVLHRFNMAEAKSTGTPIGSHFRLSYVEEDSEAIDTEKYPYSCAVGSIMYAMIGSRPDLAYGVGLISRFMSKPGLVHWEATKWLLRYIKGSQKLKLTYTKGKDLDVCGYCDSDFAADLDRRRSISGYVFTVGGNTISWRSCLQQTVALSTTEAEYMSLTEAAKEAIWIKGLMNDFGFNQDGVKIWCDSQSAICLSKNNVYHERTKHMATKRSFLRDISEEGKIEVLKIHTSRNPADILTKSVPIQKFVSALEFLKLTNLN